MSTATATATAWYSAIAESFCSPTADLQTLVAEFFKTLPLSHVPRPGDASPWSTDEWRSWALANGFYEEADTGKHGKIFVNNTFQKIRFSRSDTGGDWRASQALATEVKRTVRSTYELIGMLVRSVIPYITGAKPKPAEWAQIQLNSEDDLREMIRSVFNGGWSDAQLHQFLKASTVATPVSSAEFSRVMKVIEREFSLSPRHVLNALVGKDDSDRFLTLIKSGTYTPAKDMYDRAVDFLEQKRAEERVEREIKRLEREKREKEQEAAKAERESQRLKAVVTLTPEQELQSKQEAVRRRMRNEFQAVIDVQSLLYGKLQHYESMINGFEFPTAPPADTARVADLEKQLSEVALERDALRQSQADQAQQLAANQREITDMTALINAPNVFKDRYDEVVKVVNPIVGSRDMFAIVAGLSDLGKLLERHGS